MTLICYRPGSKAKLPRIITTGPVHYIFFPRDNGRSSPYSHILLTRIPPGRARSQLCSMRWRANGWICKYVHLSKRILMVCTPDYLKLPRGVVLCTSFSPLTSIVYVRKLTRNLCVKLPLMLQCKIKISLHYLWSLQLLQRQYVHSSRSSLFCKDIIKVGKLLFHSLTAFVSRNKREATVYRDQLFRTFIVQ